MPDKRDPSPDSRVMLVSIHPRHVREILAGRKTQELRRVRPNVAPGQAVLIYATAPTCAVVATARVARVDSAPPDQLRARVLDDAALPREEYDAYFEGRATAHAIGLKDVTPLLEVVTLAAMRRRAPYQPPQTWHFLDSAALRSLVPARVARLLLPAT